MDDKQRVVQRVYDELKRMAANYEFKPDARVNESELAKQLNTSRTPLREALNRLVAEGFLTSQSGKGFFCRSLTPSEIMNLYQARTAIEAEAVRLAVANASDEDIAELETFLEASRRDYKPGTSPVELVRLDEEFHMRLTALSGNTELVRLLENVNGRIHYIRLIDLRSLCETQGAERVTTAPHRGILETVKTRDAVEAETRLRAHIDKRMEAITQSVRFAFAELYAP